VVIPRTPLTGEGKREEGKGKGGKGMGRRVGDEGYRTGMRGGDGIRKKGKGKGREAHVPVFSNTPSFNYLEISLVSCQAGHAEPPSSDQSM
jgi:hypothetical protein